jgi:hypothetical protein
MGLRHLTALGLLAPAASFVPAARAGEVAGSTTRRATRATSRCRCGRAGVRSATSDRASACGSVSRWKPARCDDAGFRGNVASTRQRTRNVSRSGPKTVQGSHMISPADPAGLGLLPLVSEGEPLPAAPIAPPRGEPPAPPPLFVLENQPGVAGPFASFDGDVSEPPPPGEVPDAPPSPTSSPLAATPGQAALPAALAAAASLLQPEAAAEPEAALQGFSEGTWETVPQLFKQGVPVQALITLPPGPDGQPRSPQLVPVVGFRVDASGREQVAVAIPLPTPTPAELAGAPEAAAEAPAAAGTEAGGPLAFAQLPRGASPYGVSASRTEAARPPEAGVDVGASSPVAGGERAAASERADPLPQAAGPKGTAGEAAPMNPNLVLPFVVTWLDRRDDLSGTRDRRRRGDGTLEEEDPEALAAGSSGALHEIRSALDTLFGGWPTTVVKTIWAVGSFVVVGVLKLAWWGTSSLTRRALRALRDSAARRKKQAPSDGYSAQYSRTVESSRSNASGLASTSVAPTGGGPGADECTTTGTDASSDR